MDAKEVKIGLLNTLDKIISNAPIKKEWWEKAESGEEITENRWVTIKYNGNGVMRLFNDKGTLEGLRKKFNSLSPLNTMPKIYTKPSPKPTGKSLSQLFKEYEEEAENQRYYYENLKETYYYYLNKGIPGQELKLKEWEQRENDFCSKKITLKSLKPLFGKIPSSKEFYEQVDRERKYLKDYQKTLTETKETILSIPSLSKEMGLRKDN